MPNMEVWVIIKDVAMKIIKLRPPSFFKDLPIIALLRIWKIAMVPITIPT